MWGFLAQLIGGPVVNGLINAYKAKLEAGNTSERIAADLAAKEVALAQREREVQAQIIVAEQGNWWTSLPRPLFAFAFVIYVWKLVVWDKVLGWGSTDGLSPELWQTFTIILTAYFGGRSIEKVARILRR